MENEIKENGWVIKSKESNDFFGVNMLNDHTFGEPINAATIFDTEERAKEQLEQLDSYVNIEEYEIKRIERQVIWKVF